MALVALEAVTFTYPDAGFPALRAVSVEVEAGELLLVAGRSGSGKTTLLRHLKSALAPHGRREGRVLFQGRPLEEVPAAEQARRIGYVMQSPHDQIVSDTVAGEMAFCLESLGWDPDRARNRIAETVSFFGMTPWFDCTTAELSGGQKQLLSLAAVMAAEPEVLVLDEPTAQLDPIATMEFLSMVRKLNTELGVTVVMGEQCLEEAFAIADRAAVLDRGALAAFGTPRAVAGQLYAAGSSTAQALPSPLRIYCEVEKSRVLGDAEGALAEAPLTVREGRSWLRRWCGQRSDAPGAEATFRSAAPDHFRDSLAGSGLSLDNVWFRYRREAKDVMRGLSLEVPRGSLCALLGDNGAGKSTLLKIAGGLHRPYRGAVKWEGRRIRREAFRIAALLPQDPQLLFSKSTVKDELGEMERSRLRVAVASDGAAFDAALSQADVVDLCGLKGLFDRHPLDLSGGEQQRLALAKVLLADAPLLLLDEPTKGADALFKGQLADLLAQLKAGGKTVLLASHDVEFCARHADRCALVFQGAVTACEDPRQFFARNRFYTTAASRMSRGIFEATVTDDQVVAASTALAASRPGAGDMPDAGADVAFDAAAYGRLVDSKEAS